MFNVIFIFCIVVLIRSGIQICIEENSNFNVSAEWNQSLSANNVTLDQSCYNNENQITKNCANSESQPCLHIEKYYNLSACPPGFEKFSHSNNQYCYQTKDALQWDYPCLKSGGASVITDLSNEDVNSLLTSLRQRNISRFFWLPAKRAKFLSQVQWFIPGPKWGHFLQGNNNLRIQTAILKSCLLLDIELGVLTTEICTEKHPSLCFYINDINYFPAKCPDRYHSVRYMPDEGICLGIEYSYTNLTYSDFINNGICKSPMGDGNNNDLTRFIFKKIAELNKLLDDEWCWFTSTYYNDEDNDYTNILKLLFPEMYMSINNIGTLSITSANSSTLLSCMACQTEVIYEKTELMFEYIEENNLMYLTVYYPSGLWKYNQNDRGIQCFSDAKGSVKVIDINELPLFEWQHSQNSTFDIRTSDIMMYEIHLITDRAAQYWCEGHTIDFSLIKTNKIVVNPQGHDVHVFSLVIKVYVSTEDIQNILETVKLELSSNITNIFNAKKVLLMEYLEYSLDHLMVLMHMDIAIENIHEEPGHNIQHTYNIISKIARSELPKYNYILINISSSMYCLPTTSDDNHMKLNWELTPIGHIAAPSQFCLQENGLPVRRMCAGSYLLGSYWSNVQGNCNQNYKPSHTTTFLYNFVKGLIPDSNTSRFLTDGLGFVLSDTKIIIPADIYYLSMSLQHFLNIAHDNQTSIEMGNIDHIAWVMDRISVLDYRYLRLAQTLNSTNIILDSVNHIIEMLVRTNKQSKDLRNLRCDYVMDYQIAIQPQFIIQISYPSINNISGLAVIRNSSNNTNFMDVTIKPLFKNTTLDEVLSLENLEIATWLPENVLNSLIKIGNESKTKEDTDNEDIHITMNVFYNDAIFQELDLNKHKVNSRIIGVSIPGFISNFNNPMPLVYKNLNTPSYEQICGYWNFQKNSLSKAPGYWSNSGCYLKQSKNGLVICECYHLTHFGQLLNMGRNKNVSDSVDMVKHNKSLNIISLVGSFLSLLGIAGIWITASVFQAWRKKAGTKVLLHLSASIALPLIFMIVFNLDNSIVKENNGNYIITNNLKPVCIALGALLHYSVLASFMWMLITAVLQFIRYVRVLGAYRPSRFMIKFTLIGWGIPLIPVAIVLILDKDNYIPNLINKQSKYSICYPTGFYMIVSVIAPIAIILIINVTLFILVICAISKGPDGKLRSADVDLIGAQLRLSVFLFFLLGLTWIFGIFSFSNNLMWSYLFCLTSTLQGFVLFVYFIICDSQTRNLWVTLMKPQFLLSSSRESITSMSND